MATTTRRTKAAAPRLTRSRFHKLVRAILDEARARANARAALLEWGAEARLIENVERQSARRIAKLMAQAGLDAARYAAALSRYGMPTLEAL